MSIGKMRNGMSKGPWVRRDMTTLSPTPSVPRSLRSLGSLGVKWKVESRETDMNKEEPIVTEREPAFGTRIQGSFHSLTWVIITSQRRTLSHLTHSVHPSLRGWGEPWGEPRDTEWDVQPKGQMMKRNVRNEKGLWGCTSTSRVSLILSSLRSRLRYATPVTTGWANGMSETRRERKA